MAPVKQLDLLLAKDRLEQLYPERNCILLFGLGKGVRYKEANVRISSWDGQRHAMGRCADSPAGKSVIVHRAHFL